MLRLHKISVPTPYPMGPVNAYLLPEEPCTLVDPGLAYPEAETALELGLNAAGVQFKDIKKIIVTHFHPDHCGLAGWVQEKSGAKIYLHRHEVPKLTGEVNFLEERLPFLVEAGLSEAMITEIKENEDLQPARSVLSRSGFVTLSGGETLTAGGVDWQVFYLPGHSSGHICLYEPGEGNFISGDFLLERITPNTLLEVDPEKKGSRAKSLEWYLKGLDVVEKLNVKTVWPGHGREFSNYRQIIEEGRRHHEERCKETLEIIEREGNLTALQIMFKIFGRLRGFQVFLGLSEVLGHLDYLRDRALVKVSAKENVVYYYL